MTRKQIEFHLELLNNGKKSVENMTSEECRQLFGLPQTQVLQNLQAAIEKAEAKLQKS